MNDAPLSESEDVGNRPARVEREYSSDTPKPCDCEDCPPQIICGAQRSPHSETCTRPAGHTGKHRACGIYTHNLAEWE